MVANARLTRRIPWLLAIALMAPAPSARAEKATGRQSATGRAGVSLTIPSFHGMDVEDPGAEAGASPVVFASRREAREVISLRVISTNARGTLHATRSVAGAAEGGAALASRRVRHAPVAESSSSHAGAMGWTELLDRVALPAASGVASGDSARTTVVYELWEF